ncbi:uncharacterized protein BO88DRAFT_451401 [Aspergillus vadensis CBS 113365]|uniref:Uncharacterized protein n=1 Tax=Aspergillus vadensis (strain CBS 113365 / IMI 142717 / IBT 24658) TaxID=1448311 RepID=A0A319BIG4_ASPVC|nr:hypothetical protein BO88DRAFT_451401 [Aspergillus vadensis CBS 113365]PYH71719.1 hypothetical protein BO88DRAFT_451401 [Aspergillus vadensis CBS 113365]
MSSNRTIGTLNGTRHRELPCVNFKKLYLMPGDPGYILWTAAKRSFRVAVTEALKWQFEGDELDDVLNDVLSTWPVVIGELGEPFGLVSLVDHQRIAAWGDLGTHERRLSIVVHKKILSLSQAFEKCRAGAHAIESGMNDASRIACQASQLYTCNITGLARYPGDSSGESIP